MNLLFHIIDLSVESVNLRFGSFGNVWLAHAAGNSRELRKSGFEADEVIWPIGLSAIFTDLSRLVLRGEMKRFSNSGLADEALILEANHEAMTAVGSFSPNQTPEPTATLVTPRADARVAPSAAVAHL